MLLWLLLMRDLFRWLRRVTVTRKGHVPASVISTRDLVRVSRALPDSNATAASNQAITDSLSANLAIVIRPERTLDLMGDNAVRTASVLAKPTWWVVGATLVRNPRLDYSLLVDMRSNISSNNKCWWNKSSRRMKVDAHLVSALVAHQAVSKPSLFGLR